MIAADIMTADARTIGPNATIAEAVEMMQRLEVRHLPVVDEDGELVGMVSDRDLRGLVALPNPDAVVGNAETVGEDLPSSNTAVSEVMGGDVATIEPEMNVDDVIDRLLESRAGALPVVGDDGKLAGIVSYVDVLRCWQELRKTAAGRSAEGEARGRAGNGAQRPAASKGAAKRPAAKKSAAKKSTAKKPASKQR